MFYVKKYYRKAIIIGIPIILLIIIIILVCNSKDNSKQVYLEEIEEVEKIEEIKEEVKSEKTKKVNIKGAVVNPGVYSFNDGDRVIDIIDKSGGLLENADTSVINLSKNLFDEMVIIVYTYDEVSSMKENNVIIQYVEKECVCPEIKNDACIKQEEVNNEVNNKDDAQNVTENIQDNTNNNSKISINTATAEQLQTLSGIGLSKAEAIIKYREDNGQFTKIEDIMNVSGIGEKAFEKIKDNITV